MYCKKSRKIIGILLGLFMVFNVTTIVFAEEFIDPNEMTRQLLVSGHVSSEVAARVNDFTTLYQVGNGDSLWSIADQYGMDWEIVAAMNYISDDDSITPGQVLVLPVEKEAVYTVQGGDVLGEIARVFKIHIEEIMEANGLIDPDVLSIGQELVIPGVQNEILVSNKTNSTRLRTVTASTASRGASSSSFDWPVIGKITSPFGPRNGGFHHGIDIAVPTGTDIKAARAGEVEFTGWLNVYGKTVILNHGSGYQTLYAHNNSIEVKKGQQVYKGQTIAKSGNTGITTGPHSHFEVILDEKRLDPLKFLKK